MAASCLRSCHWASESDTDLSRNTRSALVPSPGHNYPHSQETRGKPRSELCIFYFSAPCHFIKHCPMTAGGWLIEIWGWIPFCPILHGSQPSCERPVSDSVWWSHVILPDVFDRKGLAAFKIQLPIDPVPPARQGALLVKSNSAERICLQNWKELPRDHIWSGAGLPLVATELSRRWRQQTTTNIQAGH